MQSQMHALHKENTQLRSSLDAAMNFVQPVPEYAEQQGGEARSEADVTHSSELSIDSGSRLWRLSLMGSLGGKLPGEEISAPPGLFLDTESQAVHPRQVRRRPGRKNRIREKARRSRAVEEKQEPMKVELGGYSDAEQANEVHGFVPGGIGIAELSPSEWLGDTHVSFVS